METNLKNLALELQKRGYSIFGYTKWKPRTWFTAYDGKYFIHITSGSYNFYTMSVTNKPSKKYGTWTIYLNELYQDELTIENAMSIFDRASNHFWWYTKDEKPINYNSAKEFISYERKFNDNYDILDVDQIEKFIK